MKMRRVVLENQPRPDARTDARTTPAESTYRDHKLAPLPIFDRSLRE